MITPSGVGVAEGVGVGVFVGVDSGVGVGNSVGVYRGVGVITDNTPFSTFKWQEDNANEVIANTRNNLRLLNLSNERVRGVEPLSLPWEGSVRPLNYTRR